MNITPKRIDSPLDYLPYIIISAVLALPSLTGGLTWLFFITPLPIFYYLSTFKGEIGAKIIARSSVFAGLLVIIKGAMPVLLFSFSIVPIGFIFADSLRKEESQWIAALKAIVVLASTWALLAIIISSAYHTNIYISILQGIDQVLVAAFESYKVSATSPPEIFAEFSAAFSQLRLLIPRIFPGIIGMTIISMVWINLVIGDWLLKKKHTELAHWKDYRNWRLPEQMVWGVIVAGLLLFISNGPLSDFALNILLVLSLIYFYQGLAVITFLLIKWRVPKSVKIFLFMLLVFQAYGMIILVIIGLADVWLDFRSKRPGNGTAGTTTQ